MKKSIVKFLSGGLLMGLLAGCGNDMSSNEMVNRGQENAAQGNELQAGSAYVENEKEVNFVPKSKELMGLREKVKEELGGEYWPEVFWSEEKFTEETGITEDMYKEVLAEEQLIEANIDQMVIVHAKEEYVGEVEQKMEDYRTRVIEENRKYPQNHGKAEASRIETIENYICFVQLGADTSGVADKGEEAIVDHCQDYNERAIDILEKTILQ